jgi:hypothetical protein
MIFLFQNITEAISQCLQPKDGLGYGWVFLEILGSGWVWVFAAPVWVGFQFFIFQKTRFSVGFWVFSKFKKNWKFSGKIVLKEEKNPRKSFNSSNLLQSIGLQWREKLWFHQKPTKIFDGQPLQHKIVRLLNAGPRIRPTYDKLVLTRSNSPKIELVSLCGFDRV